MTIVTSSLPGSEANPFKAQHNILKGLPTFPIA